MPEGSPVEIERVRAFWEQNPVAASAIPAELGTAAYFSGFDALREADNCEPYALSEAIHGYSSADGLRVLDIGCGNGYVLYQYARHGASVAGVDLTKTAVELSRKRFELGGLKGEFLQVDGNKLPFPDGHFDIVCSMGVLHHVSDPRPMVEEIFRVLRPGGRLIVMLYYRHSWKNLVLLRLRRLFDPHYRGRTQQEALNMNDGDACPLALVYSRREAAALFSRFSQFEFMLTQLSWRQLFILPPLIKLAERVLPPSSTCWPSRVLGWNLNIKAVKPPTTQGVL
ncbi:class I SAM-dependent methyltransferase [Bradyrhizobium sp. JYMT SZCCT0180]|uniref:class I SAM-dependent methyltransferase n=1 Tax=Bradyrhizobium sp. JYMT SZCCT0180 TaxID=2807666 RepID=UPI001BA6147E|nr:class I SAM-dependent methyltransferase [Bradyrhizobium sp. JYMT SZCCT0180]MBR1214312.1 class I SAM-dependent methyltransferase [Bradyrhizobium sp. JYMT SZCCT0180]